MAGFNLLTPLAFNADEFHQVCGNVFQNKRLSTVFKENENSQPYYINAIVWKSQNGSCFTGTVDGISSRQYIKVNKPFIPKTFYIDVFDYEVNKETNQLEEWSGWWESEIKDNKQLNEVFEYYDFYSNDKN